MKTKYIKLSGFMAFIAILITTVLFFTNNLELKGTNMSKTIYDFKVKDIDNKEVSLKEYEGKVLLIVNVASKCGYTPQYKGLEEIYRKFKDRGFEILAFPCNQFGSQEPGTNEEIKEFCSINYDVTFPLFDKIDVNGDNAHPLYKFLTDAKPGVLGTKAIKWNFTKFLIGRDGVPYDRYGSSTTPESLSKTIEELLQK